MDKNISPDSKSNQLAALLNENMGKSGVKMNKARVRLISMVILAPCKVQTVSFHKLALAFDNASTSDSSPRRLRRFIAGFDLCGDLIARLIFGLLPEKTGLKLVIDRTNWQFGEQNINIRMPGIVYRNVAFPLMFTMPDKKGNSNSEERIALIGRFIRIFGKECVDCVIADREFVWEKWIGYLNCERIRYYIRIGNNFKVLLPHKGETVPVSRLFNRLEVGESTHYPKIVEINGRYCHLSATLSRKRDEGPELLVIISFNRDEQSFLNYRERWQVETLFECLKSSGFDIENTHLQDIRRIEKLLCLVMIALVWCYKAGDYLDRHVKPIPIKKHGHRAKSVFKYGLEYISNILSVNYLLLCNFSAGSKNPIRLKSGGVEITYGSNYVMKEANFSHNEIMTLMNEMQSNYSHIGFASAIVAWFPGAAFSAFLIGSKSYLESLTWSNLENNYIGSGSTNGTKLVELTIYSPTTGMSYTSYQFVLY